MKSKYLLIFVLFILLIANITYADHLDVQKQKTPVSDKIVTENNLLEVQNKILISSESKASEQSPMPVIIILKNQPLDKTAREIKQKHTGQIEDYRGEINSILNSAENKLSPRTEDARRKEAWERERRRKTAATAQQEVVNILNSAQKKKIKELGKELDEEVDSLRKKIIEKQEEATDPERKEVKELLEDCPAIITGESAVINSVFARIDSSCLDSLRNSDLVAAVYEDKVMPVDLDVSVPSMLPTSFYNNGYTGGIWDVAVVDTGIDFTHPSLSGHSSLSEVFHSAGQFNPSYADDPESTDDLNGHGTHVAGIVASTDSTYAGVSYGLDTLINAKNCYNTIYGGGLCPFSDGMEAIDWAISTAGADVISRSIGMCSIGDEDCAMARYLDAVVDSLGIHVVNSAGNAGPEEGTVGGVGYNILSVAAVNDLETPARADDTIADFSSRGPTIGQRVKPDLAAPGTAIMSAAHDWEKSADFVSFSGTSMAAPHVSGAITLLLDYKGFNWDPRAVKALLLNTADNDGTFSSQNDFGRGYIDLDHAYVHQDDVFESSVSEGGALLYRGNVFPDDKATLVWNRHVTYDGTNFPSNYSDLNDLDLYLFDETNNEEISTSLTSVDNVEQVEAENEYESAVLKVDAWTTDFVHGSDTDDFALATEEGFVPVLGPSFSTVLAIPENATDAGFTVTVDLNNIGDLDAHNTEITLNLAAGLLGGSTDFIGSVPDNSSASLFWFVTPTNLGNFDNLSASVISDSYGELFTSQSDSYSIIITDDDATVPFFSNLVSPATSKTYNGINVSIDITDDSGISSAILHYDYGDDGTEEGTVAMDKVVDDTYTAMIPPPPVGNSYTNKKVSSYIIATDGDDDREGDTTSAVLETLITLLENEAPSIDSFEPTSTTPNVDEGDSLEFSYTASDSDGDNLTTIWILDSIEQATTEAWTYSPDYVQAGAHTITVIISDGIAFASQEWVVTVNDVNQPPHWDPAPENQTIAEEATLIYDLNASDPDDLSIEGSAIEYSIDNPDFNIDSEGLITWTAPENFVGTKNIQITASDGIDKITADIIITVTNINDHPVLEEFAEVEVSESDLVLITPVVSDEDGDLPIFNYTAPLNSVGQWQTNFDDAGTYVVTVTVDDGNGGTDSKVVTIVVHNDLDEDSIPDFTDTDDDNDGWEDIDDHLRGDVDDLVANIPDLDLSINNETNVTPTYTGVQEVKFFDGDNHLIIFNFDFSAGTLNLGNITINQNEDPTTGSIIVKGIELSAGETKTIYIEKLKAESNSVCVRDQEISSIAEISSGCNLANEIKVDCPGTSGSYTCSVEGDKFRILGLQHSGVKEFYIAPPAPAPSGGSGGGGGGGGGGSGGGSAPKKAATAPNIPLPTPAIAEIELPARRESLLPEKIPEIEQAIPALQSTNSPPPPTAPPSTGNFLTGAVVGFVKQSPVSDIAGSAVLVIVVVLLFGLGHSKFVRKEKKAFREMFRKKHTKFLLYLSLAALVIFVIFSMKGVASSELGELAACLNEKGVIYYHSSVGCSNCPLQENILGESLKSLTTVDCAEELERCKEEDIPGVPSWKIGPQFYTGVMRLPLLKLTAGC